MRKMQRTLIILEFFCGFHDGLIITVIFEGPFIQNGSWKLLVFFSIGVAKQLAVCFLHMLDRPSTDLQRQGFRAKRAKHLA